MAKRHTPTPWHLGTMLVDPGVEGWDGTIQAPPTPDDVADAQARGYDPAPYTVAEVGDEADARLIVTAVNAHADLLAACEKVAAWLKHEGNVIQIGTNEEVDPWPMLDVLQAAIAKAKGDA